MEVPKKSILQTVFLKAMISTGLLLKAPPTSRPHSDWQLQYLVLFYADSDVKKMQINRRAKRFDIKPIKMIIVLIINTIWKHECIKMQMNLIENRIILHKKKRRCPHFGTKMIICHKETLCRMFSVLFLNCHLINVDVQTDFKPGLKRKLVPLMAACKISINCLFGALSLRETSQHFAARDYVMWHGGSCLSNPQLNIWLMKSFKMS